MKEGGAKFEEDVVRLIRLVSLAPELSEGLNGALSGYLAKVRHIEEGKRALMGNGIDGNDVCGSRSTLLQQQHPSVQQRNIRAYAQDLAKTSSIRIGVEDNGDTRERGEDEGGEYAGATDSKVEVDKGDESIEDEDVAVECDKKEGRKGEDDDDAVEAVD